MHQYKEMLIIMLLKFLKHNKGMSEKLVFFLTTSKIEHTLCYSPVGRNETTAR